MSSRPGRVAAEITNPFGPDRNTDVVRDSRFLDLREELAEQLG
jgi:hypothetical protein